MKYVTLILLALSIQGCKLETKSNEALPQCEDNGNGKSKGKDNIGKCKETPEDVAEEETEEDEVVVEDEAPVEEVVIVEDEAPVEEVVVVEDEAPVEEVVIVEAPAPEITAIASGLPASPVPSTWELYIGNTGAQIGYSSSSTLITKPYNAFYISDAKLYINANASTGAPYGMPISTGDDIYFDNTGCTGNAVVTHWYGTIGQTKMYAKNGLYYVYSSTTDYDSGNPFNVRSKLVTDGSTCIEVSNTEIQTRAANLVEVPEPIHLQTYAPFTTSID